MLKDHVLTRLLQADGFLSGSDISRQLQVSRAAVNQAVKSLRADGYTIDSVTNRGYRLVSGPDRITVGSLQALLGEERMERILCYDVTDSTNRRLQEAVLDEQTAASGDRYGMPRPPLGELPGAQCAEKRQAPHGLIAVANEQTAGRGRLGRSFSSPHDMGIYLSILIRPEEMYRAASHAVSLQNITPAQSPASSWTALTSWTAVAVCRAIEAVYGVQPGIKWVNDLYLGGKKICGILTQMDLETESGLIRDIIIGIGVNVQQREEDFPEELRDIAGSLYQLTGKRIDRTILAAEMIRQLDRLCEDWAAQDTDSPEVPVASSKVSASCPETVAEYLESYRRHSLVTGRSISVITPRETREAIAVSIGDDFSLHVRYADGTEEDLRGGEISIRSSDLS